MSRKNLLLERALELGLKVNSKMTIAKLESIIGASEASIESSPSVSTTLSVSEVNEKLAKITEMNVSLANMIEQVKTPVQVIVDTAGKVVYKAKSDLITLDVSKVQYTVDNMYSALRGEQCKVFKLEKEISRVTNAKTTPTASSVAKVDDTLATPSVASSKEKQCGCGKYVSNKTMTFLANKDVQSLFPTKYQRKVLCFDCQHSVLSTGRHITKQQREAGVVVERVDIQSLLKAQRQQRINK